MSSLVNFSNSDEGVQGPLKGWVAFRMDASATIGTGHFMRCRTLAERFIKEGLQVYFFMRYSTNKIAQMAQEKGIHLVQLIDEVALGQTMNDGVNTPHQAWLGTSQTQDAASFIKIAQDRQLGPPKLVVVDHYALDARWEQAVASFLMAPVLAIDDLCDRNHECDFLLDSNYGRVPEQVNHLVPPTSDLLLGVDYALLRDEFETSRAETLPARLQALETSQIPKNILVSMGGADQNNVVLTVLESFMELPANMRPNVTALLGAAYPHTSGLEAWVESSPLEVEVIYQSEDVSRLIAAADVCIGASGQSTWERCCLGLPTINIVLAKNQEEISINLGWNGAIINAGNWRSLTPGKFATKYLEPLMQGKLPLKQMAEKSSNICDGKGVERVFERLSSILQN